MTVSMPALHFSYTITLLLGLSPSLYELCAMQSVTGVSEAQTEVTAPDVHPDNCFFIPYLPPHFLYLMHCVLKSMYTVFLKGTAWPVSGHM